MTTSVTCPLCPFQFTVPKLQAAPGVAAALGMSAGVLLAIHSHRVAEQLEEELTTHLDQHGPKVWLPALMQARGDVKRKDDIIAELLRLAEL